jgi:hypothetical protein
MAGVVPMTHYCPRCELRFRTESEVKQHLAQDHDVVTEGLDRYRYRAAHEADPLYVDAPEHDVELPEEEEASAS